MKGGIIYMAKVKGRKGEMSEKMEELYAKLKHEQQYVTDNDDKSKFWLHRECRWGLKVK